MGRVIASETHITVLRRFWESHRGFLAVNASGEVVVLFLSLEPILAERVFWFEPGARPGTGCRHTPPYRTVYSQSWMPRANCVLVGVLLALFHTPAGHEGRGGSIRLPSFRRGQPAIVVGCLQACQPLSRRLALRSCNAKKNASRNNAERPPIFKFYVLW